MTTTDYRTFTGSAAETYQRCFVPAIATPASTELLRIAALAEGERVVDVACGTGVVTRLAAAAVGPTGSVAGVDLAPDMIDVAAAIEPPDGASIEWHRADAVSLPVLDRSHDVVLCQMGLMFMDDPVAALREMHRTLRPGGRLVLTTPGPIQPPFEELERAITQHVDPGLGGFVRVVFSMHDPDEVGGLVSAAGFGGVAAMTYVAEFDLPAPAEFLWQYVNLTPMAPLVAQASEQAKAATEAQVVDTWAPFVVGGRVPLAQPMVLVHARRS
jgi:SAM-dependent methyltransferase